MTLAETCDTAGTLYSQVHFVPTVTDQHGGTTKVDPPPYVDIKSSIHNENNETQFIVTANYTQMKTNVRVP